METLRISLPWPPSVNHYWRSVPIRRAGGGTRGTRVILSREGRAYRQEVQREWRRREPVDWSGPLKGRLEVKVMLLPPTRRKFDIDNRMKALLDALEHAGVYLDDGQIDRLEIERWDIVNRGTAVVEISEVQMQSGRRDVSEEALHDH